MTGTLLYENFIKFLTRTQLFFYFSIYLEFISIEWNILRTVLNFSFYYKFASLHKKWKFCCIIKLPLTITLRSASGSERLWITYCSVTHYSTSYHFVITCPHCWLAQCHLTLPGTASFPRRVLVHWERSPSPPDFFFLPTKTIRRTHTLPPTLLSPCPLRPTFPSPIWFYCFTRTRCTTNFPFLF